MNRVLLGLMFLLSLPAVFAHARQSEPQYEADLSHLPAAIARDVEAWRQRLETASCLKVVCDAEETWTKLYELDLEGRPVVAHREHYQIHSWMTPDTVWMVIFPYEGDAVDTTIPHYQMLWKKEDSTVWERTWLVDEQVYRARKRDCSTPFGPEQGGYPSRGCIYATGMTSWLAGGRDLSQRDITVVSVGLLRSPNIAIAPPDPSAEGVWLDVFTDALVRDLFPDNDRDLYRRNDLMLLARNDAGEPEVREWRTNVLTDPEFDGKRPQQITAIRRMTYTFFQSPPTELSECTDDFIEEIERAVAKTGPGTTSAKNSDRSENRNP